MNFLEGRAIGIVGLGQMGGSFAWALKTKAKIGRIIGYDLNRRLSKEAVRSGILDARLSAVDALIFQSQIVVLALPIGEIVEHVSRYHAELEGKLLVVDLGSVRAPIQKVISRRRLDNHVGVHPICGTALCGYRAWNAELYNRASCVLFRNEHTKAEAVHRARELLKSIGGKPMEMDYRRHDSLFAITSGLPHLFAYALSEIWREKGDGSYALRGPSFHGATRVAQSDPVPVAQMLFHNRRNLLKALTMLEGKLSSLKKLLEQEDGSKIPGVLKKYGQTD